MIRLVASPTRGPIPQITAITCETQDKVDIVAGNVDYLDSATLVPNGNPKRKRGKHFSEFPRLRFGL